LTFKQVPFDAKATLSKSRAVGLPLVSQQFLTASV
jgi:hypothetical protein